MKKIFTKNSVMQFTMVLILALLVIVFSFATQAFATLSNILNLLRQISMLGLVAVGMAIVLISGSLDLSVGAQISLVTVVAATLIVKLGFNPLIACILGVLCAVAISLINCFIIVKTGVFPMIATIAMTSVVQGLCYIIAKGVPIYGLSEGVKAIGQGYVGIIPIPIIIMAVVFVLGAVLLKKTHIGRYFYAVGGNKEATRLSGISTWKVQLLAHLILGVLTGLTGLIMMARIGSGQPKAGVAFEGDVLTACVVGGVALSGGSGTITGVFIGSLIIGVLSNGLSLMGVSEYYQLLFKGIVLLGAVSIDSYRQLRAKAK